MGGYPEPTSEPACKCKKQEREICSSVWGCSCLIFSASTNKATIHRGERHITWYSISFTCCTILIILIWTTTTSKYVGWQEAERRGSASGPSTCVIAHEIHSCHCRHLRVLSSAAFCFIQHPNWSTSLQWGRWELLQGKAWWESTRCCCRIPGWEAYQTEWMTWKE